MKLKSFSNSFLGLFLFSVALLCLIGTSSFDVMAQKSSDDLQTSFAPDASVMPVQNPGGENNPTCKHLSDSADSRFAHIMTDASLKLDAEFPSGTFKFITATQNGIKTELTGATADGNRTVTISSTGGTVNSFSSQKLITAVIVKGGNQGAFVYPYPSGTFMDTNLTTPNGQDVSHVVFCFDESIAPTSAPAAVSGRIGDESNKPVARALVTVINLSTGEYLQTQTDMFGRYKFANLPTGEDYLVRVYSRKYSFTPNNKHISLLEDLSDLNFVAVQKESLFQTNR